MARPLVLAGPILRRVERNRVVVWVALSLPAMVRMKVWPGIHAAHATNLGEIAGDDPHPVRETTVEALRFGSGFYVALVDLKLGDLGVTEPEPVDPPSFIQPVLDPATVYSYNLHFTPTLVGDSADLRTAHLLEARPPNPTESPQRPVGVPLGYADNQLPSFATCPTDVADLYLLQASCRNWAPDAPNAGRHLDQFGADDLMTAFDPLIEDNLGKPLSRPHQLFLTGDQIYADEVAGAVLPSLTNLAHELLATHELIRLDGTAEFPLTTDNFPADSRQKLCGEQAKFTSVAMASQLIGLGEFYAAYLMAWSETCWDSLIDELPSVTTSAVRDKLTDWDGCITKLEAAVAEAATDAAKRKAQKALDTAKEGRRDAIANFGRQRQRLEGYRLNVPIVRRILANVPTYMICDDHEITDDWNLTQEWRNRVLGTNLGQTILRNGLVAYAVCQAWGNDPTAWTKGDNKQLLDSAVKLYALDNVDVAARNVIDGVVGNAGAEPIKVTWNYSIDFEAHRVVVLDTRNHRQLFRHQPPGLLTSEALQKQLASGPLPPHLGLLVVVSPAPVLGPAVSDHIIQPLGAKVIDAVNALTFDADAAPCDGRPIDRFGGQVRVDLEPWFVDDDAVEGLLQRLATYGTAPIVVLSGDVHYGLTAVLDYWKHKSSGETFDQTRIVQFTSSAARNVWPPELVHLLRFTRQFIPGQQSLLQLKAPVERLAWTDDDPTPVNGGDTAIRPLRTRLRRNPVLVSPRGWPDGATEQRPPDWAWRLELIHDVRTDDRDTPGSRPGQVAPPPPPLFDPDSPLDGYAQAVARHASAAADNVQLRTIVAEFNVGAVRFRREGADNHLIARGELYSRNYKRMAAPPTAEINTLHEVPLVATTQPRPALGG
jgi:hypothetical protein